MPKILEGDGVMLYSENKAFFKSNIYQSNLIKKSISRLKYLRNDAFITLSLICSLIFSPITWSEVADTSFADVTTRAFSVLWVSSEPVTTASVRVFSDIEGLDDITATLTTQLVSSSDALALGLVKVDVIGVLNDTTYYVDTTTDGASGQVIYPALTDALLEVKTAIETTKADSENKPINNDLIIDSIGTPNGIDFLSAGLLVVNVSDFPYPISAFVEENTQATEATGIFDLNNLFDTSGSSAKLIGGEKMDIKKFRGLLCDIGNQLLVQSRKVPEHLEIPVITELESPADCFSPNGTPADLNCDNRIGLEDLGKIAARYNIEQPDCRFNPDFDFDADGRIDDSDFDALVAVFGTSQP